MVLRALSSIRDHADWLSLDATILANLTDEDRNERIKKVAKLNHNQLKLVRDSMDFATMSQVQVAASVVQKSLAGIYQQTAASLTVDMKSRTYGIEIVEKISLKVGKVSAPSPFDFKPVLSDIVDIGGALLLGVNNILMTNENPPTDTEDAPDWNYDVNIVVKDDNFDIEVPTNLNTMLEQNVIEKTKEKSRNQVIRIHIAVKRVAREVMKKCVPGEIVPAHSENGASVLTGMGDEPSFKPGPFFIDATSNLKASITLPQGFCPSRYLDPKTKCLEPVGLLMIIWPTINHLYPDSSQFLSSRSRIIDFEVSIKNRIIHMKNEPKEVIFDIPRDISNEKPVNNTRLTKPKEDMNNVLPFIYHKFTMKSKGSSYSIDIIPNGNFPKTAVVFIDNKRLPTPSKFLLGFMMSDFEKGKDGTLTKIISSSESTGGAGSYYIGVANFKSKTSFSKSDHLKSADFNDQISTEYRLAVKVSGCFYFNELKREWSSDGLRLISSSSSLIRCASTHLSSFGAGFTFQPNDLDFTFIYANSGFQNNELIYATLIIMIILYVMMLIWAFRQDKKDTARQGAIPLPDNKVEDKYLYEVIVQTGPDCDASTESNISMILSGDKGDSLVRRLPPSEGVLYRRFEMNTFVMAMPGPLGHINLMRLFHDNSGEEPLSSWQVEYVTFRDLQTNQRSVFELNAWLAFDQEDGKIDKTFMCTDDDNNPTSFSKRFYLTSNRTANQDNLFLSIFMRPLGSRYSRKERVTVFFTFVYLSMLICAIFFNTQSNTPREGFFEYGLITLSIEQIIVALISVACTYPIVMLITFFFKRARPKNLKKCRSLDAIENQKQEQGDEDFSIETDESQSVKPKQKSPIRCLPWWLRYVAWVLSLSCISGSVFFVWAFGITWGEIKVVKFFSSFITTFFLSFLVTQWIKVVVFSCCLSSVLKTDFTIEDIDCDEEKPHLKKDEKWFRKVFIYPNQRKKVYTVVGVQDQNPETKEIQDRLSKEREMRSTIKAIILYSFFLTVIYLLVGGRTDYNGFLLQNHLKNTLIKPGHREFDFSSKVHTSNHWWNWAKNNIIQDIRAQRLYNNDPPYGLKGFLNDWNNRIMGYAIIRQVRSARYNCVAPSPMDKTIEHCSGSRGITNEDSNSYCANWYRNETFPGSCDMEEFKYKTADELKTYMSSGRIGNYGGGGYVIRLTGIQEDLLERFNILQKHHWIDQNTRAVFLEFSVYNANINLFATCVVSAEFNEGGGILPKWRFEPLRLIKSTNYYGTIVTVCEIIFALATFLSTGKEFWKLKNERLNYFANYWNIVEVVILLVSYIAIGLYGQRSILTKEALDRFQVTYGNGYVRMDSAAYIDSFYIYSMGVIVFFSTIKLIKLLQFNKRMNVLSLTIGLCWDELKIFLIAFAIIFFAFSCLFYFLFHTSLEYFSNILSALQTSFKMMMGKFDFEAMNQANSLSPVLFFVFSVMNSMILINIMLTIILQAFGEVKLGLNRMENRLNLIDFTWQSFKIFIRKENSKKTNVTPILTDKKREKVESVDVDAQAEVLPDKV